MSVDVEDRGPPTTDYGTPFDSKHGQVFRFVMIIIWCNEWLRSK